MIFSDKIRKVLFFVFAGLAMLAAVYHVTGICYQADGSAYWRHGIFAGISLFCCYGFLKRPGYFTIIIAVLLMQQYYSHGSFLLHLWAEQKKIHWISVFDLILLPIALLCLIEDYRLKKSKQSLP
jgi:hypothetical protein